MEKKKKQDKDTELSFEDVQHSWDPVDSSKAQTEEKEKYPQTVLFLYNISFISHVLIKFHQPILSDWICYNMQTIILDAETLKHSGVKGPSDNSKKRNEYLTPFFIFI